MSFMKELRLEAGSRKFLFHVYYIFHISYTIGSKKERNIARKIGQQERSGQKNEGKRDVFY